ncbi:MAG: hypothetical protein Q8N26_04000 [Myxococcales bacterium]|nr:hypothetical protein [Myxococcales bacterium]
MSRRVAFIIVSALVSCAQPAGQPVLDPRNPLQVTGVCAIIPLRPDGSPPTLSPGVRLQDLSSTLVPLGVSVTRSVTLGNVPCWTAGTTVRAWLTDAEGRREVPVGPVSFQPDDQEVAVATTFQTLSFGRLELEVDFGVFGTARRLLTAVEDRTAAQPVFDAVGGVGDQVVRGGQRIGRVFVSSVVGRSIWNEVLDGGELTVSSWVERDGRLVKRGEYARDSQWEWGGTSESVLIFTRPGIARTVTWRDGGFVEEPLDVPPGWSSPIAMAGGGLVGLDVGRGLFCEVVADGGCSPDLLRLAELRPEGVIAVPPGDDRFVLFDRRGRRLAEILVPPSSRLRLQNMYRGVEGAGSYAIHEGFVLVPRFDDRPRLLAFRQPAQGASVALTRDWIFLGDHGFAR